MASRLAYQASKHRFNSFNVHTTSYKRIGNHAIDVHVLMPKNRPNPQKPHPLFVKFHGGGLVLGDAIYAPHFASWLIPFIQRNNAITILPNYRLLPEANGREILDDLADFWKWFDKDLKKFVSDVAPDVKLDFEKVLVGGDSAGGLLAFMSGIRLEKGKVKAVLGQYPMSTFLRREWQPRLPDGDPSPTREDLEKRLAAIEPGSIVSSAKPFQPPRPPQDRFYLSWALSAYNRWRDVYGTDKELLPMTAVEAVSSFPPTVIFHGDRDVAVPVEDSREFKEKLVEVLGEGFREEVRLVEVGGMDHGFDCAPEEGEVPGRRHYVEEKDEWLRESLGWVEGKWLGSSEESGK